MCFSRGYCSNMKEFELFSEGMGSHQEILNRELQDFICVFMNYSEYWVENWEHWGRLDMGDHSTITELR